MNAIIALLTDIRDELRAVKQLLRAAYPPIHISMPPPTNVIGRAKNISQPRHTPPEFTPPSPGGVPVPHADASFFLPLVVGTFRKEDAE